VSVEINRQKQPGEIIEITRLSITWPIVAAAILIVLTIIFWRGQERTRETLRFFVIASGVAGGLLSAHYVWSGLRTNADLRVKELQQERVTTAMTLVARWNDPGLGELRKRWRELMRSFEAENGPDPKKVLTEDTDKRTTVADVLNFFEEVGYAVDAGVADEETLKAIFSGIVQKYYRLLYPWIASIQETQARPAYAYFEKLRNRWVTAEQTKTMGR
jgi:hypothetical protein